MAIPRKPLWVPVSRQLLASLWGLTLFVSAAWAGAGPTFQTPTRLNAESILSTIRPDYTSYVGGVRRFEGGSRPQPGRVIYMALVKPGASDPTIAENAPYAGPGAQNDIIYDESTIGESRSDAWVQLLLDHEYFHARHLAGATSLPLPQTTDANVQSHFFEAAAWGFNVAEARAGRYGNLQESEFREVLNQYGDHYRALRDLMQDSDPESWIAYDNLLRHPASLITKSD